MKKCLVLGMLSLFVGALSACRKTNTEDNDTGTGGTYESIQNIAVSSTGTSLTTSPIVTWQLGFPIFESLEIGLGTSTTATANTVAWSNIGTATFHTFTGLSLSECTTYYPMIRAIDQNAKVLDTHVASNGFRVDLSNPTTPASLLVTENGTDTKSATLQWAASTDNCALRGYDYAIGTTSGGTDVLNWLSVTGVSHQATSGVSLNYGVPYYTSLRAVDTAARTSSVATSSAWRLRSPTALLMGTQNLVGSDFYQGASYVRWSSATYDSDYFSHSVISNPETLTVKAAGDYIFRLTMPFQVTATCTTRCAVKAMVVVNGSGRDDSVANSSYVINTAGFTESSNHVVVYLNDLSANDEIKVYFDRGTSSTGTMITEGIQAQVEYILPGRSFFYGKATQTVSSTNLNLVAASISWTQELTSTAFGFSSISPDEITFANTGNYLVYFNFPLEAIGACTTRNNVKFQLRLNGVAISGAQANQAGIDCSNGHVTGSAHWFGVVAANAGDVLTVTAQQEASNSVVQVETGRQGSIIIEELSAIENYISVTGTRTVASTNLNSATLSQIQWDTQIATDVTTFTHSTVANNHQITMTRAGSYLVFFSDHLTSAVTRANVRVRLQKNGVDVSSGLCTSNIITNINANNEGSCAMNFLLSNVQAGDILTVSTIQEATAGVVTSSSPATLTVLRVK